MKSGDSGFRPLPTFLAEQKVIDAARDWRKVFHGVKPMGSYVPEDVEGLLILAVDELEEMLK